MTYGTQVLTNLLPKKQNTGPALEASAEATGYLAAFCRPLLLCISLFAVSTANAQIQADLDSDGIPDVLDQDQDNDGISNSLEGLYRIERLTDSPAQQFEAVQIDNLSHHGSSFVYQLINTDNGKQIDLAGKVISTNTKVDWTFHGALPKIRNLGVGSTLIEWTFGAGNSPHDIDMTISDLDGARSETIVVSVGSLAGYSLSLNSNIVVTTGNGYISFTGTGGGGDSLADAVSLHIRNASKFAVEYKNSIASVTGNGAEVAGFRHIFNQRNAAREGLIGFFPLSQSRNSDADAVPDHRDLDSDNDGVGDVIESGGIDADSDNMMDGGVNQRGLPINADPNLTVSAVAPAYIADVIVSGHDNDGDGILSSVDDMPGSFGGSRSGIDTDSDGLYDLDEIRVHHTDPEKPDTDEDGLTDLSELQRYMTNPLLSDTDGDGLSDGDELMVYGTIPTSIDSDLDGLSDAVEIEANTDPLVANMPSVTEAQADDTESEQVIIPVQEVSDDTGLSGIGNQVARDREQENVPFNDPATPSRTGSLHTGLNGAVGGCSVAAAAPDPDPLLPLWLAISSIYLWVRKKNV